MPNSNEAKSKESKVSKVQSYVVKPAIGHAPEARLKLDKLEELKDYLRAYLTGYTSSRELSDLCATTERRLGVGKEDQGRLFKSDFWENVGESLSHARDKIVGFPPLIREEIELKELVETFEKELDKVINDVEARANDPHGAGCIEIAGDALRSVGKMKRQARDMTVKSKGKADSLLKEMERVIIDIRHWIIITDEEAGEPSEQFVGYGTKLKEGLREDKQTTQRRIGTEEPYPSKETRAKYTSLPSKNSKKGERN